MLHAESTSLTSLWIGEVSHGGSFDDNLGELHQKTIGRGLTIMVCLPTFTKGRLKPDHLSWGPGESCSQQMHLGRTSLNPSKP